MAYSGGPGGINHQPTPQENAYSHEQHTAPTSFQTQHEGAARTNVNNYASHNGGHPANAASDRPMVGGAHGHASGGNNHNSPNPNSGNHNMQPKSRGEQSALRAEQSADRAVTIRGYQGSAPIAGGAERKTYNASHSQCAGHQPAPQPHSQPQPHSEPAAASSTTGPAARIEPRAARGRWWWPRRWRPRARPLNRSFPQNRKAHAKIRGPFCIRESPMAEGRIRP